ncbi:hypothetical protein M431DRAFT_492807 [Trichoderma harzianum CBS 226.95]|uniref:Uncharacterized protein n=1 Tax=Trichoderma harzianum CBS 226.95 TaxID=983964 RepID=A0A2T4AGY4_TRIHA|nr:hypothetical protein M431DRAFT_492807 [Trichoderma harzianum CBS 226.95]PTB56351.1 hypothetical protein M431DRAFT_492807 [Trichoderma harzianum CBS 226.95]
MNRPEWGIWIAKHEWVRFGRLFSGFWGWCCEGLSSTRYLLAALKSDEAVLVIGGSRFSDSGHVRNALSRLTYSVHVPWRKRRINTNHSLYFVLTWAAGNSLPSRRLLRMLADYALPCHGGESRKRSVRGICTPVLYGISHSYTSIRACTSRQNKQQLSSFLTERA